MPSVDDRQRSARCLVSAVRQVNPERERPAPFRPFLPGWSAPGHGCGWPGPGRDWKVISPRLDPGRCPIPLLTSTSRTDTALGNRRGAGCRSAAADTSTDGAAEEPGATAALLTGSIGGGHDALAAACAAVLEDAGIRTHTIDVMGSLGRGSGAPRAADLAFRTLLSVTPLYDAFHFSQLRDGAALASAAELAGVRRAVPAVARELELGLGDPPIDLALAVFATAAGVASRLKDAGLCRRTVVFVPDATAHRMWVHDNTDLFLVTSRLGAASVRRYWPEAPVEILDPPLRAEFGDPPTRADAREALGLPPGADVVAIMGGAWGLAPVVDTAAMLADVGRHVLAVAGRNARRLHELRAAARHRPGLHPLGYCTNVAELMAASDLVVTTAGMTCHEARAVGRGLVLLDVVPGHGRENLAHELEMGGAAVSQPDPPTLTRAVAACLEDPELRCPARIDSGGAGRRFLEALADLEILPVGPRSPARPA